MSPLTGADAAYSLFVIARWQPGGGVPVADCPIFMEIKIFK